MGKQVGTDKTSPVSIATEGGEDLSKELFSKGGVARQVHSAKSLERAMTSENVEPNDRRLTGRKPSLDNYDSGSGRRRK